MTNFVEFIFTNATDADAMTCKVHFSRWQLSRILTLLNLD